MNAQSKPNILHQAKVKLKVDKSKLRIYDSKRSSKDAESPTQDEPAEISDDQYVTLAYPDVLLPDEEQQDDDCQYIIEEVVPEDNADVDPGETSAQYLPENWMQLDQNSEDTESFAPVEEEVVDFPPHFMSAFMDVGPSADESQTTCVASTSSAFVASEDESAVELSSESEQRKKKSKHVSKGRKSKSNDDPTFTPTKKRVRKIKSKMPDNSLKIFSCSQCSMNFFDKTLCREHCRQSHGYSKPDLVSRIPEVGEDHIFMCTECPKMFVKESHLELHWKYIHCSLTSNRVTWFPCSICSERFPTISLLEQHVKFMHRSSHDQCRMCRKVFISKANYERHIKVCARFRELTQREEAAQQQE